MQLVEQGKLDLDRDVNDYLDFPIPKTYPEPITLRQLLTHTSGFEETLKNLFVPHESDMKPLRTYLANQMPARIFPPGKVPSYSNYGLLSPDTSSSVSAAKNSSSTSPIIFYSRCE
jgi:CubicO group peptidase (beta-lactamase class C family)